MSEPSESEIESVVIDVHSEEDQEAAAEESRAYAIAKFVMDEFEPGFVLIGSPIMGLTDSGMLFPDSIGIIVSDKHNITKTVLSNILLELAAQLGHDMFKLEQFVKDALNDNK